MNKKSSKSSKHLKWYLQTVM